MYKKNYIQNGKTRVVFLRHPTKTSSTSTWLWKPHLFTAKLDNFIRPRRTPTEVGMKPCTNRPETHRQKEATRKAEKQVSNPISVETPARHDKLQTILPCLSKQRPN